MDHSHERQPAPHGFQTTRWTLIDALHDSDPARQSLAMERLARQYWPAVYAWFASRVGRRGEAEDLTQGFFATVVLQRQLLIRVLPGRGSLRAVMRAALANYLIDCVRRDAHRNGTRRRPAADFDAEDQRRAESGAGTPDELFDRRWALACLDEAMRRCREQCDRTGRTREWEAFERWTVLPAAHHASPGSQAALASELQLKPPPALASTLQDIRRRLRILLREVIGETVIDQREAAAEYEAMARSLRSR